MSVLICILAIGLLALSVNVGILQKRVKELENKA